MTNIHSNKIRVNSGEFLTRKRVKKSKWPITKGNKSWVAPTLASILPFILAISGAQAQSLGQKDSTAVAPDFLYSSSSNSQRWTGFYFGASLGGGMGNSSTFYDRNGNDHLSVETANPSGYLGSISLGYNQQVGNNLVVGVEGDLGVMNFSAPDRLDMWDGHIWKSQYGGLWGTLRPRVGYTVGDMMVYGTAGMAIMQTNEVILGDNDATQNTYNTGIHTGLVYGAGIEYAVSDNLSAKVEYLQMQFPEYRSYTNNEEPYGFTNAASLLRVGLNYNF